MLKKVLLLYYTFSLIIILKVHIMGVISFFAIIVPVMVIVMTIVVSIEQKESAKKTSNGKRKRDSRG